LKEAEKVIDPRAWQILLDGPIEAIKLGIRDEAQRFEIPLWQLAAHSECGGYARVQYEALHRSFFPVLGFDDLDFAMQGFADRWVPAVREFISRAVDQSGDLNRIVSIDLVGGAFRFKPLRKLVEAVIEELNLRRITMLYRDGNDAAQTVVARGLARHAYFMG
jgi:hypothetical protein